MWCRGVPRSAEERREGVGQTLPTQSAALLWTAVAANKSCDGFSCIMFPAADVSVMNRWNQAGMLDPDHRVRFKLEQYRKK